MIRLFIDFDGTMTVNDVGDEIFQAFGDVNSAATQLNTGSYSVADYYRHVAATLRSECTPETFREFVLRQESDPGLASLIQYCSDHSISVAVVSDGFDAYIAPILAREGLSHLPVVSNLLTFAKGHWTPEFPGATEGCTCFCASCKRNTVVGLSADDDVVIYVGDGASDECAVLHSDVVFAKDSLAAYCTRNRIPHHPYVTLNDVRRILSSKLSSGDIRQRRQAVLARKSAIQGE